MADQQAEIDADREYTWQQMREIRYGHEEGMDSAITAVSCIQQGLCGNAGSSCWKKQSCRLHRKRYFLQFGKQESDYKLKLEDKVAEQTNVLRKAYPACKGMCPDSVCCGCI